MKKFTATTILATAVILSGYSFAQAANETGSDNKSMESSQKTGNGMRRHKGGPIDLEKYSRMEAIKAADADGDGTISRDELEDHAMQRIVKRMADRMERRLDVDGDGTVTVSEIENQKQKEFAALDRNEDGKLDRHEMRAGHKFGKFGKRGHRRHGGHHARHH